MRTMRTETTITTITTTTTTTTQTFLILAYYDGDDNSDISDDGKRFTLAQRKMGGDLSRVDGRGRRCSNCICIISPLFGPFASEIHFESQLQSKCRPGGHV